MDTFSINNYRIKSKVETHFVVYQPAIMIYAVAAARQIQRSNWICLAFLVLFGQCKKNVAKQNRKA